MDSDRFAGQEMDWALPDFKRRRDAPEFHYFNNIKGSGFAWCVMGGSYGSNKDGWTGESLVPDVLLQQNEELNAK